MKSGGWGQSRQSIRDLLPETLRSKNALFPAHPRKDATTDCRFAIRAGDAPVRSVAACFVFGRRNNLGFRDDHPRRDPRRSPRSFYFFVVVFSIAFVRGDGRGNDTTCGAERTAFFGGRNGAALGGSTARPFESLEHRGLGPELTEAAFHGANTNHQSPRRECEMATSGRGTSSRKAKLSDRDGLVAPSGEKEGRPTDIVPSGITHRLRRRIFFVRKPPPRRPQRHRENESRPSERIDARSNGPTPALEERTAGPARQRAITWVHRGAASVRKVLRDRHRLPSPRQRPAFVATTTVPDYSPFLNCPRGASSPAAAPRSHTDDRRARRSSNRRRTDATPPTGSGLRIDRASDARRGQRSTATRPDPKIAWRVPGSAEPGFFASSNSKIAGSPRMCAKTFEWCVQRLTARADRFERARARREAGSSRDS